jgi:hypothetical protein
MLREIRADHDVVRLHPLMAEMPVFVDECDPGVPAHMGVFDNGTTSSGIPSTTPCSNYS